MKLALQLYTVRDAIYDGKSLLDTLEAVKGVGYQGVEFAGYFDLEPERLRDALGRLGLVPVGSHYPIDLLEEKPEWAVDYARRAGISNVVMAWSPCDSPEQLKRTLTVLQKVGSLAKNNGLKLLYHNHAQEFRPIEGSLPLEQIAEVVQLELDCYWAFFARHDPARFLLDSPGRTGLLHIKDGKSQAPSPCAVGEGECNIADVVRAAHDIGQEWLIVENDNPTPNGIDDAARSFIWLKDRLSR